VTRPVRVALAQIAIAPLDPDSNRRRVLEIARHEAQSGADLIVFPELSLTGYVEPMGPGQEISTGASFAEFSKTFEALSEPLDGPTITSLSEITAKHDTCVVIGMSLRHGAVRGSLGNASVLIGPSGVMAVYDKVHLWQNEKLFFRSGESFPVAETGFGRVGMQVCYDIRFPEATRCLALGGAEIVTNVWASFRPDLVPSDDPAQFRHRAFTRAQENGVFFLSCNRVGQQGSNRFMGHSVICRPSGAVLAEAAHEDEDILRAELDLDEVAAYRSYVNLFDDRKPSAYAALGAAVSGR
tara:strand:- start:1484 stop:2374 length:891 start_codon:yes stop_codon:yes gene_type:complete